MAFRNTLDDGFRTLTRDCARNSKIKIKAHCANVFLRHVLLVCWTRQWLLDIVPCRSTLWAVKSDDLPLLMANCSVLDACSRLDLSVEADIASLCDAPSLPVVSACVVALQ